MSSSDEQVYKQIQQMSDAFVTLKDLFKKKNQQIQALLRQKENLTCTCKDQALWIDKLKTQFEQLQADKTEAEEKLTQLADQQQHAEALKEQLKSAQDELSTTRTQLDSQQQQQDEINRKYTDSQSQLSDLQKQLAGKEQEINAIKTELKTLADIRAQYDAQLETGQEKDRKIESLTINLSQITTKVNGLTEQLNHQMEEVEKAQKVIDELEDQIEPHEDDPAYNLVQNLDRNLKDCKQIFGDSQPSSDSQQTSMDDSQTSRRNDLHRQLSILNGS